MFRLFHPKQENTSYIDGLTPANNNIQTYFNEFQAHGIIVGVTQDEYKNHEAKVFISLQNLRVFHNQMIKAADFINTELRLKHSKFNKDLCDICWIISLCINNYFALSQGETKF